MDKGQQHRSLASVKLTKRFHWSYMGLWVLIGVSLLIAVNILLILQLDQKFGQGDSLFSAYHAQYASLRGKLLIAIIVETALFSVGFVVLAILTSHRIAGPYIRLHQTFEAIRNGDTDIRLKFREYDKLEHLQDSFNGMMDTLREKMPKKGEAD